MQRRTEGGHIDHDGLVPRRAERGCGDETRFRPAGTAGRVKRGVRGQRDVTAGLTRKIDAVARRAAGDSPVRKNTEAQGDQGSDGKGGKQ